MECCQQPRIDQEAHPADDGEAQEAGCLAAEMQSRDLLRAERRHGEEQDALLLDARAAQAVEDEPAAAEQEAR